MSIRSNILTHSQRILRVGLSLKLLVLALFSTVPAITLCHDYVIYRVTCSLGQCENVNETPPTEIRRRLGELGYSRFPITNTVGDPELAGRLGLKPGDVVFLGDLHSGFVNDNNRIDHFIQVYGQTGIRRVAREPDDLPKAPLPEGVAGGLFLGHTFENFHGALSEKGRELVKSVEVWRRSPQKTVKTGWSDAGTFTVTADHTDGKRLATGVRMKKGQRYRVEASGAMTVAGQSFGPGGYGSYQLWRLLASVGSHTILLGPTGTGIALEDGEMKLGLARGGSVGYETYPKVSGAFKVKVMLYGESVVDSGSRPVQERPIQASPTGASPQVGPDALTGTWNVNLRVPNATYALKWETRKEGGIWRITQTIVSTDNRENQGSVGYRYEALILPLTDGTFQFTSTSDPRIAPGTAGYFRQTARCTVSGGGVNCQGTQQDARSTAGYAISFSGFKAGVTPTN